MLFDYEAKNAGRILTLRKAYGESGAISGSISARQLAHSDATSRAKLRSDISNTWLRNASALFALESERLMQSGGLCVVPDAFTGSARRRALQ